MTNAPEPRRQRAIERYLAGDPIADICRDLACSNSWRYKWRDRSLATDPSWSAERSSSPRTTPTNTPQRIEQAVVALRQTLAQQGKDGGAASIQQALEQHGLAPVPSHERSDSPPRCTGGDINQLPASIRPSAGTFSPSTACPSSQGHMAA